MNTLRLWIAAAGLSTVAASFAHADETDFISSEDVRPAVRKMSQEAYEAQMGQRNEEDLMKSYAIRTADPKASKRERH